jgi:hypothetical protein
MIHISICSLTRPCKVASVIRVMRGIQLPILRRTSLPHSVFLRFLLPHEVLAIGTHRRFYSMTPCGASKRLE